LFLQHRYPAGIVLMQSSLANLDSSQIWERAEYSSWLGQFQHLAGDEASARSNYIQVREILEATLRQQPDNTVLIAALAQAHAALGDKSAALKQAELAIQKLPASRDAFVGPSNEEALARVLARVGEKDRAIATLQHLLTTPYNGAITPALLRLDPDWDNLRGNPRFVKLCQEKQQ
jgi:tetratricopeptide (TPR) repeat protein